MSCRSVCVLPDTWCITRYQQYLIYLGDHRAIDDVKRTGFEKRPRLQARRTVGKGQTVSYSHTYIHTYIHRGIMYYVCAPN